MFVFVSFFLKPIFQYYLSLQQHDLVVSGIDWSPVHNKIVSCSHDRNAFVWTYDSATAKWMPALVILRIDRAALDVKWSLDGLRFAVTSGAKCAPVCTYEESNDWWVSKHLKKKFKSTVLCCAFHPRNGQLLATGSSDFKCRIYSTFDSSVDAAPDAGVFAKPLEFGEVYCELSALGWVAALAWSPSGEKLCFAGELRCLPLSFPLLCEGDLSVPCRELRIMLFCVVWCDRP